MEKNKENPLQLDGKEFQFIKELKWDDVFEIWRKNEEHLQHWVEHYKSRGFNTWEAWRKSHHTTQIYGGSGRKWYLYKILTPESVVLKFRGGPFTGWISRFYKGEQMPAFYKIAKNIFNDTEERVREIIENFPKKTTLLGLKTRDGVIIIEGMHRATAIALAERENIKIRSEIYIALTKFDIELVKEHSDKNTAKT